MKRSVTVHAPCRLHFGMFSFGHADLAQFGGVGAMVDPPAVKVSIIPADSFAVVAERALARRVRQLVDTLTDAWQLPETPRCEIEVDSPASHSGLGVGTQLALSVAAGLRRMLELPDQSLEALADATGRGMKSAVGTYGFQQGGLIVDAGKTPGQTLGTLSVWAALPEAWRFVLICPQDEQGLAGESEVKAFARLPPVPLETTRALWRITHEELLPAVESRDLAAFGEAVFQFGRRAGECFAPVQGGSFATPEIARLINSLRDKEVFGVGQSSWGPTIFALAPDDEAASRLASWLRATSPSQSLEVTIAKPSNRGAAIDFK